MVGDHTGILSAVVFCFVCMSRDCTHRMNHYVRPSTFYFVEYLMITHLLLLHLQVFLTLTPISTIHPHLHLHLGIFLITFDSHLNHGIHLTTFDLPSQPCIPIYISTSASSSPSHLHLGIFLITFDSHLNHASPSTSLYTYILTPPPQHIVDTLTYISTSASSSPSSTPFRAHLTSIREH
jgi:hypothetical protein